MCLSREVEEKRSNLDGNVDEIAKELQRMENKKHYLEEEKTDLSEALDRQRHIFESKVTKQPYIRSSNVYQDSLNLQSIELFLNERHKTKTRLSL